MKKIALIFTILTFVATLILVASTIATADQKKAKNTVDNIREVDPPQVSTETKKSPVGQNASEYRPKAPSLKIKEPPSPIISNPKKK